MTPLVLALIAWIILTTIFVRIASGLLVDRLMKKRKRSDTTRRYTQGPK